jgi:hypothetical protein
VQVVVKLANQSHLAIVPSGGALAGGAAATNGEVVVS